MTLKLDHLRHYAVARTLFSPTTLPRAIAKLGFVQADPIRAPARAQDLTLRHRVANYGAGDLEARYPHLPLEEDFFVNYGFLPRPTRALMHPREARRLWSADQHRRAKNILALVRERGAVHPRDVEAELKHGRTRNWFGGSSHATTLLLDGMHYRGMVRTVRREGGIRIYGPAPQHTASDAASTLDELVDVIVNLYAPLPEASLGQLLSYLGGGVPQWRHHRSDLVRRSRERLASAAVEGVCWYWPANENPKAACWRRIAQAERVRLLTPFDPIVWDRRRFELLWGWAYRFEAYTPASQRLRGYYAMPLLWQGHVLGWGNLSVVGDALHSRLGYVSGKAPDAAAYPNALTAELEDIARFLAGRR